MMTGSPQTDPRLAAVVSERGFNHMPAVHSEYGGEVTAYESSAASAPHIWLRITCPADLNDPTGPSKEAVAHLTAENATVLFRQLAGLVANHYQLRDDEEPPDPRAEALRRELQFDKTTIQLVLEAVDASDEASGVRRVTGAVEGFMFSVDFDPENAEERCINRALATFDVPDKGQWHSGRYVIAPLAADSPVGGVS